MWEISACGTYAKVLKNAGPSVVVGREVFSGVDYEGTMYVEEHPEDPDDDFIGFVFGYHNRRKFYLASWKKGDQDYWSYDPFLAVGKMGFQVRLVDSKSGVGKFLRGSLWHAKGVGGETRVLYEKKIAWDFKTLYRWKLVFRPHINVMWIRIFKGKDLIVDTGIINDATLRGGRLGLYNFSQIRAIYTNFTVRCNESIPVEIYN